MHAHSSFLAEVLQKPMLSVNGENLTANFLPVSTLLIRWCRPRCRHGSRVAGPTGRAERGKRPVSAVLRRSSQ